MDGNLLYIISFHLILLIVKIRPLMDGNVINKIQVNEEKLKSDH